jgi:hypothetical protein
MLKSPLGSKNQMPNTRIDAHGRQAASGERLRGKRLGTQSNHPNIRCPERPPGFLTRPYTHATLIFLSLMVRNPL